MEQVRQTARKAAYAAGEILKQKLGNIEKLDYKSAFNIVTDADQASEQAVIGIIRESHPGDEILGEESGALTTGSNRRWLIDPLDGTTNYAHGYPFFCVSIGFEEAGELKLGIVYNPVADEFFYAERGKGTWLGERQVRVSATATVSESLLTTGFPPDSRVAPYPNMTEFHYLTDMCHGVRRDGSAALDLCFVACGRIEGFWEYKLAPWDLAAGVLAVEEGGGRVTSVSGGPFELNSGHVLATNGLVHAEMISLLNESSSARKDAPQRC